MCGCGCVCVCGGGGVTVCIKTLESASHFEFYSFRLTPREFNSYGSRRGNDDVMTRGTFANIRLVNKFMQKAGPKTIHVPSGKWTLGQEIKLLIRLYYFLRQ